MAIAQKNSRGEWIVHCRKRGLPKRGRPKHGEMKDWFKAVAAGPNKQYIALHDIHVPTELYGKKICIKLEVIKNEKDNDTVDQEMVESFQKSLEDIKHGRIKKWNPKTKKWDKIKEILTIK